MASATQGPFIAASQIAGNILDWGKPLTTTTTMSQPSSTATTNMDNNNKDELKYIVADRHKHYDMIHTMMTQIFSHQEPITRSVGASPEDVTDFFHDLCAASLNTPYSVLAFGGDKLIGMTLNYINTNVKKSDEESCSSPGLKFKNDFSEEIAAGPYNNPRANRVCSFIEEVERNYTYFIPRCKKLLKLDVVFVHPNYAGKGIGTKLTEKAIQVARENNCDYIMSVASAKGSAHIFSKLGFTCVREVPFLSFHENGHQVFQNLHDGNTSGKLMILKLGSSVSSNNSSFENVI